MEIGSIIAFNLKRLRDEQNLSQGQLAEKAGLSKVIVSQIERGDANPTINTIWKLTGALGIPYGDLLELPQTEAVHVRRQDCTAQIEAQFRLFCYYAQSAERNFEMYAIELEPGCDHASIGHSTNSFEYVMVVEGQLALTTGEQCHTLQQDDALYFDASRPHRYQNTGTTTAKAVMLIQYL